MQDLEAQLSEAIERHRGGDVDSAVLVYRKVLESAPDHAEARHMMAVVNLQKGRLGEAESDVRHALRINVREPKYANTLGSILVQQGRLPEALAAFEEAIANDPAFVTATYNMGTVLLSLGRPGSAERQFRKILGAGSNEVAVFSNLAAALIKQGRITEAVDCCRDGLQHHPYHPDLSVTLASALELANDLEAAEGEVRKVHDAIPDFAPARLILARILRRRGATDDAFKILTPIFQSPLSGLDEAEAHYEMGLIQDVRAHYANAFDHFSRCNSRLINGPEASPCDGDQYFDAVRAYRLWKTSASAPAAAPLEAAPKLVFFVGFPRSGTTLMEQVLKSHPKVITTEENSPLPPVEAAARKLAADQGVSYPDCLDAWGPAVFDDLRRLFMAKAEDFLGPIDEKVLVDKLPLNIVSLGLVEKLWPEARILVALRDPRDVCLSCFIQSFTLNNAMVNFLDLERTGRLYSEVMGLWLQTRELLTLPYLEYRYEDLVDNLEGTTRAVLEFVGVDCHDDVARYRDSAKQRVIRTPSYREVTAPVHQKAVARWKNYQDELTPIFPHLDPFVKAFDYDS